MLTIIEMPSLSSTMKKGKVVKWHKLEGDPVKKGEILYEVETDKVNVEVEALTSGLLRKILVKEGVEVPVHTPIAVIADTMDEDISSLVMSAEGSSQETEKVEARPRIPKKAAGEAKGPEGIRISPLAKRIAEEKGIDIRGIQGTGPGGRITRKDVERVMALRSGGDLEEAPLEEGGGYEDKGLTKMRSVIAQRLQESKANIPHFYLDMTVDAEAIIKLKDKLNEDTKQHKVTVNDILIKIVSKALRRFPEVNAHFLRDRIRIFRSVNVGVAVALDEGLVVPVVKNADRKSIQQISLEVADLVEKARTKKLLPEEYKGGTFTITNLGMFGVEGFHAIINPPESGILAVGAIAKTPAALGHEIAIRPRFKLSLAVDHRVVDGATAACFLSHIKDIVESPFLVFL